MEKKVYSTVSIKVMYVKSEDICTGSPNINGVFKNDSWDDEFQS